MFHGDGKALVSSGVNTGLGSIVLDLFTLISPFPALPLLLTEERILTPDSFKSAGSTTTALFQVDTGQ